MIGERRNCDPGLLLSIDFKKCDGEYFRSQDAYGNKVKMIGNLWRLGGAKLNGTSEYFIVPDRDNLSFGDGTNDKPFSITAWVNMDDATDFIIVSKGIQNENGEWRFGALHDLADRIMFILLDESNNSYIGKYYPTALTSYEGDWIHLVGTYDGTGYNGGIWGVKIYINGVEVSTSNLGGGGDYVAMEKLDGDVWIGRDNAIYSDGQISNLKIWNRKIGAIEESRRMFQEGRKAA